MLDPQTVQAWAERVSSPTLVIHGDDDRISPLARAEALAEATGGELVVLEGAGHLPLARDPVQVNLLIRDFVDPSSTAVPRQRRWARGLHRARRALYVSSPIGLGHARRDLAIAAELRRLYPDLEIDWLAQHPVTRMLDDAGERVHPASSRLASESAHIESESGEHRLHCFQAWRRMDEILLADFMVFHDVVERTATMTWSSATRRGRSTTSSTKTQNSSVSPTAGSRTSSAGCPCPRAASAEANLTADYNAEMIEHIERYPRVRDLALFVGNPNDIVADRFGAGLPLIREWTEAHYQFPGYVTGFDPGTVADRDALRDELGYAPDERVCVVTVGGSGVGTHLLRRLIDTYPLAASAVPGLRMLVVAGPRIDPASLPAPRRSRSPRLSPQPAPPSRRQRSGRHPRRPHHLHGAHRNQPAIHLPPPPPTLRAAVPRPPPPAAIPRRTTDRLPRRQPRHARGRHRRRDCSSHRLPPRRANGAARAAAAIATLL